MVFVKRPLFFKVFFPDLSSERLRIPVGFLKHMEGKTSGSVSLKGPSGNTWHVDLIQNSEGLFFQDGWPVFARDHLAEIGDFFVFRYDGNLHFTVCIFDPSACEKEAAFYVKCSQDTIHNGKKRGKKKGGKLLNVSSYKPFKGVPKRMRGNSHLILPGYITRSRAAMVQNFDKGFEQEDVFTTRKLQGSAFFNGKKKRGRPSKNTVNSSLSSLSKACKDEPGIEYEDEYFTRKHQESAFFNGERKRGRPPKNIVNSYLPSLSKACKDEPGFEKGDILLTRKHQGVVFLNERKKLGRRSKSFVSSALLSQSKAYKEKPVIQAIPKWFSQAHLPKYKTEIVLHNPKGESWIVTSVPNSKALQKYAFCGGWTAFVRDNKIKTADICIFELMGKLEMCVHIVQRGKQCRTSKNSVVFSYLSLSKAWEVNQDQHLQSPKSDELVKIKAGVVAPKNINTEDVDPFIQGIGSRTRGCLARSQSTIEEEREKVRKEAKSFTSKFPYFIKCMKKFNVHRTFVLSIPNFFSAHFPTSGKHTEIVLRNSGGEPWIVNLIRRGIRYTICGGWASFIHGNKIEEGDTCAFVLVGESEMRVHIFRLVKEV
ncbi:hypothetical protein HHK36_030863 [Tetracentron sinense]|uniref:TF-B3 domain-containing protein n=1 Tax=Tetracentron sinense TaxID=13715 RepID=A0A834Y8D2_TETSI|nr:hypothetical protein HHK36_030863 [Tetracentron sinense]